MRHARTAGTLLALLVLVRCGAPTLPATVPGHEAASAPTPPQAPTVVAVAPAVVTNPEPEIPYTASVRGLVRILGTPTICARRFVDETGQLIPGQEASEVKELRLRGEAAYADYEAILTDPDSEWQEISGTCRTISKLPGDRRRFVPSLTLRLATPDALVPGGRDQDMIREWIRRYVIETLEDICDERSLAVLVRVMQQDELESAYLAARALTKFGGQNELDALTSWLVSQNPNLPGIVWMKRFRDEMEMRLRAKPAGRGF